jgi:hypothetical protein
MKAYLLLSLFLVSANCSFSKDNRSLKDQKTADSIQRRIDFLICDKEHQDMLDRIEREKLVSAGTVVANNIATYRIKNKKGAVIYTLRYSIKQDKIISISGRDK